MKTSKAGASKASPALTPFTRISSARSPFTGEDASAQAENQELLMKEVRREEANKRCFLCLERGPSYVDMDHCTFVCTFCAGLLREFSFAVKSVSLSTFTLSEVKKLKTSSNAEAKELWLANFNLERPPPNHNELLRNFIKSTFIFPEWVASSAQKRKPEAVLTPTVVRPPDFNDEEFGDFQQEGDEFGDFETAPKEEGFDEFVSANSGSQSVSQPSEMTPQALFASLTVGAPSKFQFSAPPPANATSAKLEDFFS